jgi:glucan phosphorylase
VPNFNVQNAHMIYPAANLSEQISTAGKEASGTGNMKFMINGDLTIGTLDGANVEMREEAGAENFFLFGLTEEEVRAVKAQGYRPADYIDGNDELRAVLDLIAGGTFSRGDTEVFRPLSPRAPSDFAVQRKLVGANRSRAQQRWRRNRWGCPSGWRCISAPPTRPRPVG